MRGDEPATGCHTVRGVPGALLRRQPQCLCKRSCWTADGKIGGVQTLAWVVLQVQEESDEGI